jgi:hypothetical protein
MRRCGDGHLVKCLRFLCTRDGKPAIDPRASFSLSREERDVQQNWDLRPERNARYPQPLSVLDSLAVLRKALLPIEPRDRVGLAGEERMLDRELAQERGDVADVAPGEEVLRVQRADEGALAGRAADLACAPDEPVRARRLAEHHDRLLRPRWCRQPRGGEALRHQPLDLLEPLPAELLRHPLELGDRLVGQRRVELWGVVRGAGCVVRGAGCGVRGAECGVC